MSKTHHPSSDDPADPLPACVDRHGNPVTPGPVEAKRRAGRPAKADIYKQPQRLVEKIMIDHLEEITYALIDLARGTKAIRQTRDGEEEVYETLPDRRAAEAVLNRVLGKPVEKKEITKDETKTHRVVVMLPENFRDTKPNRLALPDPDTLDTSFTQDLADTSELEDDDDIEEEIDDDDELDN